MSFLNDNNLAKVAEKLVFRILENSGYKTSFNIDKDELSYYDLVSKSLCCKFTFTSEVKFDSYQEKSGNIAIEYYNSKKCSPSGISITKSNFWFCVLHKSVWICKTNVLKEYVQYVKPLKDLVNVGDNNACIKLYKDNEILNDIFKRVDNISISNFRKIINEGI